MLLPATCTLYTNNILEGQLTAEWAMGDRPSTVKGILQWVQDDQRYLYLGYLLSKYKYMGMGKYLYYSVRGVMLREVIDRQLHDSQ